MGNPKIAWVSNAFADHASLNKNPEHIIKLVIASGKEIYRILRSHIGKGGIDALFHRSIEVTAQDYPWLAAASTDAQPAMDIDVLHEVLSKEDASHFAGASDTLLLHFYYLLTNLIGLSLSLSD